MKKYLIQSSNARNRGAIGVFYPISETIQADSKEQAIELFRAKYESNTPVTAVYMPCHITRNEGKEVRR